MCNWLDVQLASPFTPYLLMIRLHLLASVEYGVGVAQQLFITTLNLRQSTSWQRDRVEINYLTATNNLTNVPLYLLLRPFASIPIKTSEPISEVSMTYGASLA